MEYSNKNFEERTTKAGVVVTKTLKNETTKPGVLTKTLKNEITKPGV